MADLFEVEPPQSATAATLPSRGGAGGLLLYSLAIFASAFLLFQIQPLIGKLILPWFGGTAGVWSTCMVFFQVLLFGGYAYAHLTTSRLSPRAQAILHTALLVAACLTLPILPADFWKPTGNEDPNLRIVALLAATVGLPFFALSATGPLLQRWFSQTHAGRSPYRLYALSNVGSLLALITYPAVFDWLYATRILARYWSWGFVAFAVLCSLCAALLARTAGKSTVDSSSVPASAATAVRPSKGTLFLWFALAMVPSILLLATTNQVCLEVASVPFLWVLPLSLYLLSFIICFDNDRWYSRRFLMPAAAAALVAVYLVRQMDANLSAVVQVLAYFSALFFCAMVCHGELARRRPAAEHLTAFYLLIAAGGAVGGSFVGIAAPYLFSDYYELHLGLFACAALLLATLYTDRQGGLYGGRPRDAWFLLWAGLATFGVVLFLDARAQRAGLVAAGRNFYGVLRVIHGEAPFDGNMQPADELWNGRIVHGVEYSSPQLRRIPTAYFNPGSGVGRLLLDSPGGRPRRVGVIGLGIGTLAAYAKPGDSFCFYEINPMVERMARDHFHYLSDCPGKVEVVLGDARLALEREEPRNFDVLILDAFSGDAIPLHLLTDEAFAVYLRHLAPDGVIAVHISNIHFAFVPVIESLCEVHKLKLAAVLAPPTSQAGRLSLWVLMSRRQEPLETDRIREAMTGLKPGRVHWTDDHASLLDVWLW